MKQALTCQQSIRSPPSPPSPPLPVFVFHTSHIEIWSVTLWRKTKKQGCEARVGKKRVKSSFLCECVSVRENARHGNCRVIVKQRQTVYELRLAINPKENTNFYLSRTYAFRYWSTCHATFCYCRFIGAMSHSSCASEVYIRLKVKSTFSSVFCARTTPELCSKVVTPSERKRNCGSCEVRACVRRVCVCAVRGLRRRACNEQRKQNFWFRIAAVPTTDLSRLQIRFYLLFFLLHFDWGMCKQSAHLNFDKTVEAKTNDEEI